MLEPKTIVGKKIRRIRALLGVTQAVFGKMLSVDQIIVSRWELGALRPTFKNFSKINKIARKVDIKITIEDLDES